jgi:hypothetical protein
MKFLSKAIVKNNAKIRIFSCPNDEICPKNISK